MIRSILLAAALLAATPALAAPFDDGQAPSVRVSYADLDLGAVAGRATLQKRVAAAVRQVCPIGVGNDLNQVAAAMRCRRTAQRGAAIQIARAGENGRATQLALAGR